MEILTCIISIDISIVVNSIASLTIFKANVSFLES